MSAALWQRAVSRPLPVLLFASALFALPLFLYLTPTLDDGDFVFYRLMLTEFSAQFWQGDIHPRWLYAANDGLGSPAFIFLGPGAYYPTVLLQWMSGFDADGTIRFILSILVARMLAGWLCYRWLLRHLSREHALVATLLFLTIPYTVHEIYARKELAEQWAFVCMFLILPALDTLSARRSFAVFTLASAALILVHLPSFITFGWIPFLYVLCLCPREMLAKRLLQLVLANALATALTAYYWLPLLQNKEFINAAYYFTGAYTFRNNFLVHVNEYYCIPYFVFVAAAYGFVRKEGLFLRAQFYAVCIIGFMLLPISVLVWELLPPLHYLQFPYRFLNIALLPFAVIAAYLVLRTRLKPMVLVVWAMGALFQGYVVYAYAPRDSSGALQKIPEHKLVTLSEYRTQWQKDYPATLAKLLAGEYRYNQMPAKIIMDAPGEAILNRLYFPGMEVINVETQQPYPTFPTKGDGLLGVKLDAGSHHIETRLFSLRGHKNGAIISLCSLLVLLGIIVSKKRREHETQR